MRRISSDTRHASAQSVFWHDALWECQSDAKRAKMKLPCNNTCSLETCCAKLHECGARSRKPVLVWPVGCRSAKELATAENQFIAFVMMSASKHSWAALTLSAAQNKRGGRVKLHALVGTESEFDHAEKGDALYAFELALCARPSVCIGCDPGADSGIAVPMPPGADWGHCVSSAGGCMRWQPAKEPEAAPDSW